MNAQTQTRTQDPAAGPIHAVLRHFVTQQVTDVELPADWTVDHATHEIARAMTLPERNAETAPQEYDLFVRGRDGVGTKLRPSARVRDAIRPGDEIEPMPEVVPGRGR